MNNILMRIYKYIYAYGLYRCKHTLIHLFLQIWFQLLDAPTSLINGNVFVEKNKSIPQAKKKNVNKRPTNGTLWFKWGVLATHKKKSQEKGVGPLTVGLRYPPGLKH